MEASTPTALHRRPQARLVAAGAAILALFLVALLVSRAAAGPSYGGDVVPFEPAATGELPRLGEAEELPTMEKKVVVKKKKPTPAPSPTPTPPPVTPTPNPAPAPQPAPQPTPPQPQPRQPPEETIIIN